MGTIGRSGLEGGDGIITLAVGVTLVVLGWVIPTRGAARTAALVLLIIAGIVFVIDLQEARDRVSGIDNDLIVANVGVGLWTILVGVAAGLSGLVVARNLAHQGPDDKELEAPSGEGD